MWIKDFSGGGGRVNLDTVARLSAEYINPAGYYVVAHLLSTSSGTSNQVRVSDYFPTVDDAQVAIDDLLLNGS